MMSSQMSVIFLAISFVGISGFPYPVLQRQFPIAYNLRTNPNDVNALEPTPVPIHDAAKDVRSTIEEVQALLEQNPTLPRLTRGEIEDLFEQVTREEYEKSLRVGDISRAKHMRSLMLVLPYNTNSNSTADLQDLYTRRPVTKIVSSEPKPQRPQKVIIAGGKVEILSIKDHTPTTYKPFFRPKYPEATTYRPQPMIFVTTTTESPKVSVTPPDEQFKTTTGRFSSHYNAERKSFVNLPQPEKLISTTSKPKITPELEELLESLGFSGQSQSKKRFKLDDPPPLEELNKPAISSLIKQDTLEVAEFKPIPLPIKVADFKQGLEPQIKPGDFLAFKPIPTIASSDARAYKPELEDYLLRFGLVDSPSYRSQKSINLPEQKSSSIQKIPAPHFPSETFELPEITSRMDEFQPPGPIKHSFKPVNYTVRDQEDLAQLESLLETLKELQKLNVSLTPENLQKLDPSNYNFSDALIGQGPNPVDIIEVDSSKNEIKRQTESPEPIRFNLDLGLGLNVSSSITDTEVKPDAEVITEPAADSDVSTTDSSSNDVLSSTSNDEDDTSSTSTTTTTEESRNGDISDLEDSFPGGLDPVTEEPLPSPKPNGFYFLADWNSFLEVGEDPDRVVVRFDPKIGDPSRFIPVNVP